MKRVLIVEDEDCIRAVMEITLCSRGHEVLLAANGDEAIEICKRSKRPIDVLLCDVMIPGATAEQVVKTATSIFGDLKVLLTTGHARETVAAMGFPKRLCVLQKPFPLHQLNECLKCLREGNACDTCDYGVRRFPPHGAVAGGIEGDRDLERYGL